MGRREHRDRLWKEWAEAILTADHASFDYVERLARGLLVPAAEALSDYFQACARRDALWLRIRQLDATGDGPDEGGQS